MQNSTRNKAKLFIANDDLGGFIAFCDKENLDMNTIKVWRFEPDGSTLLHLAIENHSIKILKHLIEIKFPLDLCCGSRYNAFHDVVCLYNKLIYDRVSKAERARSKNNPGKAGNHVSIEIEHEEKVFLYMAQMLIDAGISLVSCIPLLTVYSDLLRGLPYSNNMLLLLIKNNVVIRDDVVPGHDKTHHTAIFFSNNVFDHADVIKSLFHKINATHNNDLAEIIDRIPSFITFWYSKSLYFYYSGWRAYIKLIEDILLHDPNEKGQVSEDHINSMLLQYNCVATKLLTESYKFYYSINTDDMYMLDQEPIYNLKHCVYSSNSLKMSALYIFGARLQKNCEVGNEIKDYVENVEYMNVIYDVLESLELDKMDNQCPEIFKSAFMVLIKYCAYFKIVSIAEKTCKKSKASNELIGQSEILESKVSTSVTNSDLEGFSANFEHVGGVLL